MRKLVDFGVRFGMILALRLASDLDINLFKDEGL